MIIIIRLVFLSIFACVFAGLVGLAAIYVTTAKPELINLSNTAYSHLNYVSYSNRNFPEIKPLVEDVSEGPIDLNDIEYYKITKEFQKLIDTQDPSAALSRLEELTKTNNRIGRSCHGLAHEIGRRSYKKYNNFSQTIAFTNDVCGNGFTHGVIEQHFATVPDIYAEITKICAPADLSCIHGVGHGIMYFKANDVFEAIPLCEKFPLPGQVMTCSEAIFHENYETNSAVHKAKYLNPTDPFELCRQIKVTYMPNCYYYAGRYIVRLNKDNYTEAAKVCATAGDVWPSACARGIGAVVARQNINSPAVIGDSCAALESVNRYLATDCLGGAVSYFSVNARSGQVTKQQLCANITNQYYKNLCYSYLGGR